MYQNQGPHSQASNICGSGLQGVEGFIAQGFKGLGIEVCKVSETCLCHGALHTPFFFRCRSHHIVCDHETRAVETVGAMHHDTLVMVTCFPQKLVNLEPRSVELNEDKECQGERSIHSN